MRQIVVTVGPIAAASANNIALSQTPGGAGNLTLNGALVTSGVATLDVPRFVRITTVSNESAKTLTIYGTDFNGNAISEVITGPNATTADSTLVYATITRIAVSAAFTGAVTVGTNGNAASQPIPLDIHGSPSVSIQGGVSGTCSYTVQQTLNSPYTGAPMTWVNHPDTNLVAATTAVQGNYAYIPAAVRFLTTPTGSGTATITIIQAGAGQF